MPDPDVWEDIRRMYEDVTIPLAHLYGRFGISRGELTKARIEGGWPMRDGIAAYAAQCRVARAKKYAADDCAADVSVALTPPLVDIISDAPSGHSDAKSRAQPDCVSDPTASASDAGPSALAVKVRRKRVQPVAARRALVQRLTAAIETKLALLERRLACEVAGNDKATSAADAERDGRSISLIIKNLEQVREYGLAPEPGPHLRGAAAKSVALAATQLADEADRIRRELGERLSRLVETTQEPTEADTVSP